MRFTTPQWRPRAAMRRTPLRSVIEVSAFASIVLALLFLMMFGLSYPIHRRFAPTDLVSTANSTPKPAALREDALQVAVTRDGSVFFREERISPGDLPARLRDGLRNGAEKTVYVRADARARYGDVQAVVNLIRDAGLSNITFIAESSRP